MLIDATIAGREKVEVNPNTKLSCAIQGDKGIILLTETNYPCPESWSCARATRFAVVDIRLYTPTLLLIVKEDIENIAKDTKQINRGIQATLPFAF